MYGHQGGKAEGADDSEGGDGGDGGMKWEIGIDIYTVICVK